MIGAHGWRGAAVSVLAGALAACATAPPAVPSTPRFPTVPPLVVPASVQVPAAAIARHQSAWQRLQGGDTRGAARDFAEALKLAPAFYPAETGLGYLALLGRDFEEAGRRFDRAIVADAAYVPALSGRIEAALGAADDAAAVSASELLLAVDPSRDDVRSRLDVLRLRGLQSQLAAGRAALASRRLDEAQVAFERARQMSPDSAVVSKELARVEIARGAFDAAEAHARQSLAMDAGDPETHVVLADVLEAHGRYREAAAAMARAASMDPRPDWRERAAALSGRADYAALPVEYRAIPSATSVTRGQLAAVLGIQLKAAIEKAPRRVTVVLTDIRGHWAAPWILPVTRAGVMEGFPNHTFQPSAVVRRVDLAQVVWQAITVLAAGRPQDVARWRAHRPQFPDLPAAHLAYPAVAGAVAAGAMAAVDDSRFAPSRAASGSEVIAAVARLEQLAGK